jgi:hypothetical protein
VPVLAATRQEGPAVGLVLQGRVGATLLPVHG